MKFLPLILRNILRKKIRTSLTILSIAVALFLYGLLVTIHAAFYQGISAAGADRLVIRNKTSIIMPLPVSYKERMLGVDGVAAVSCSSWFGGVYQDPKNFFVQFAVEKETFLQMYPEYVVPKEQVEAFLRDKEGCIVGKLTADRFHWKLGDRIPIQGTIFSGTWEFNICGIYHGARPQDDSTQFFFRADYLEERRSWGKGVVGWYVARVANPDDAERVSKAIDRLFANSEYESVTEPEKLFMVGWLKQLGNIQFLIITIGSVVFFTLLLVTGNTMANAVRERTGELAVLKTVGFTDTAVLWIVLAESLLIALIGGLIGIGLAKLFTMGGDPTHGMLPTFYLGTAPMLWGVVLTCLVGVASGILPALIAMRLRIVQALRRV